MKSDYIALLFHYSLLLITLSEAKQTPQSRLTPSQLPYRGAYKKSPDSYLLPGLLLYYTFLLYFFCGAEAFLDEEVVYSVLRVEKLADRGVVVESVDNIGDVL